MAFHPDHVRRVVALAAVALCAGAAGVPPDRALVVTAIADDVASVVLEDGSSAPVAYSVGETVRGTPWRVIDVRKGQVTLRNARAYKGAPFEVRLRVGQWLEPALADEGNASPTTGANVEGR